MCPVSYFAERSGLCETSCFVSDTQSYIAFFCDMLSGLHGRTICNGCIVTLSIIILELRNDVMNNGQRIFKITAST